MAESASPAARTRYPALPLRLASGILLAVITTAAVWMGGLLFSLLLGAALLVALWEFLRMCREADYPAHLVLGVATGAVLLVLVFTHRPGHAGLVLVAAGTAAAALTLRPPLESRLAGLALTLFGLAYVVGLGIHAFWLREMDQGPRLLVTVLAGTWASDTAAFFVGVRWGRTPLAPRISPRKSVEGLAGGVLGAAVVTAAVARWLAPGLPRVSAGLLGLLVGAVSPVGDLLESLIKRNLRVKDASSLIPGHGGMLDRMDSILLSVPAAYYLLRFLLH